MFSNIWKNYFRYRIVNNSTYILVGTLIATLLFSAFFIYKADPEYTITFFLLSFIVILLSCIAMAANKFSNLYKAIRYEKQKVSKLRKRIIVAFSIGAALPTIVVAIFSTYLFNFGIEAWFDKKISNILDQSILVGKSYISEHTLQLKETSISVSDDLNAMYYDLINNPELFSKILSAQAEMRSIDEAIVFQKNTNTILAQTSFSFSASFINISPHLIEKADNGEVIQIISDPTKIRILIKLHAYNDTYLLIGRLVDPTIINHIDEANGIAGEYFRAKNNISSMRIKFLVTFIILSLILLLLAIIWGRKFAERIVKPIRELVIVAEQVKNGDLSAQVPLDGLKKDEIRVLSASFNRMVNQIDYQQKELIVAQKALAWEDVARRVAHEIKNPLTPIQLSIERILQKFQNEVSDQELLMKYVNNILKHSNDIKTIVSEFVDFARLPAPNCTECEIISMISDLVESRKLINSNISYSFTSNLKRYNFICDLRQINRVIVNLLLNSEEAFKKSQLDKKINVMLHAKQNILQIIISDNGLGFSKKLLKLAKAEYITTKSQGTGLGLAIVDRIVSDHCGTTHLSNNNSGGARIELTFNTSLLKTKLK